MRMGITKFLCVLLMFTGATAVFGIPFTLTEPEFSGDYATLLLLKPMIDSAFQTVRTEISDLIGGIDGKPEKFIQAWGNSSIFSSHGATQRGYGGYNLFAFTVGPMVGIQLPSNPLAIVKELDNLPDTLNKERDLRLGFNPQIMTGQFSINTSKFLLKNLYLGLRFGYMKLDSLPYVIEENIGGFSYNDISFGLMVNYQLIRQISLPTGFLMWRGLTLGTGFIYQKTNIGYKPKLDSIEKGIGTFNIPEVGSINPILKIDPSFSLNIDTLTYTIPLEVSTSFRLLWFLNLAVGAGVDFGFGKSDMKIGMSGDLNVTGIETISDYIRVDSPGKLSASAGGNMSPGLFNPKLMAGLGFNMGPVIIDIPVTWYFMNDGYSLGITLGIAW